MIVYFSQKICEIMQFMLFIISVSLVYMYARSGNESDVDNRIIGDRLHIC